MSYLWRGSCFFMFNLNRFVMENVYRMALQVLGKYVFMGVLVMVVPTFVSYSYADVVYPADSYTLSDDGFTLELWKGQETEIDMNSDENLAKVMEIGNYAFEGKGVTSIVLGAEVEKLGNGAFFGCDELRAVTFSGDVKAIGAACFSGCVMLDGVVLPETVTEIGNSAFYNCASLSEIRIPAGVTVLSDGLFNGCSSLGDVSMGDGVTKIGEETFYQCLSLKALTLPGSLLETGTNSFAGCSSLESVQFNAALQAIGTGAFSESGLKSVDLSTSAALASVGVNAFLDCKRLSSLVLPQHDVSFKTSAFSGCTALTEVVIPDTYREIGVKMFYGCTSLGKLVVGENVETIGNYAFFECASLNDVSWGGNLKTIEWSAFYGCTSLEEVLLPESLEYMDDWVFQDCTNINKVSLGGKITYIGKECFSGLPNLERMEVKAVVPPELGSYVFYNSSVETCELLVPAGSVEAYKDAEQWKDFMQVTPTSVQSVLTGAAPRVSVNGGRLCVENMASGGNVAIYSAGGQRLCSVENAGDTFETDLPSGVYVVCVNGMSVKVSVR